ncbi:MAG: hypothetical protein OEY00_13250, partial [Gammaproteobacteria bacterium]|nr:hypothetical protein [Gammaproteobacteria bacterium]
LPYPWIDSCLSSVRQWAESHQYDYRYLGDELFDLIPDELVKQYQQHRVVLSDLARLLAMRHALNEDYDSVVWLDADFLIFAPEQFILPYDSYACGREVWVQKDSKEKLKVYKKVHNAFLLFSRGNSFLDFYIETASKLLFLNTGAMPPQFIGPKLLTAFHNIASLPVMETAGMLSPLVIKDIIVGGGECLELFVDNSPADIAGANLCVSSCEKNELSNTEMEDVIKLLLNSGIKK